MAAQTPPPGAKIIDLVDVVEEAGSITDDDLDALLAELEDPNASNPNLLEVNIDDGFEPSAPVSQPQPSLGDDLDNLLNELSGEGGAVQPAAKPAPQVAAEDDEAFDPSDLDNLLEQLSSKSANEEAAAKPTAAPAARTAPKSSDLDQLLGELGGEESATDKANDSMAADDLDDLLNQLADNDQPQPMQTKQDPAAKQDDGLDNGELDDLLNELSAQSPLPPASATQESGTGLLDAEALDSLLAEIAAPAQTSAKPLAAEALDEAKIDDLDALLADLEGSGAPAASAAPAPPLDSQDDLDALLADLESSASPQATPAAPAASLDSQDDLDALLADLESSASPQAAPVAPAAPAPPLDSQDDLDALLADLESSAPPQAAPAVAAAQPLDSQDDLDLLLAGLEEGGQASNLPNAVELASLAANLDPQTVQELYTSTLRAVLEKIIPEMVGKEVARRVAMEIEAIKALAKED